MEGPTEVYTQTKWLLAGCISAAFFVGCKHAEYCKDIPEGAIPQPVGTYVCQWQHAQMDRAEADDFVIYRYEWLRETDQFSPYGGQHMMRLVGRLQHSPESVIIAPSGDIELDQARVRSAIGLLVAEGVSDAHQRVAIGNPTAEGLYGQEAPRTAQQLFRNRGGGGGGNFGFGGQGGFGSGFGGGLRGFGGGFNRF